MRKKMTAVLIIVLSVIFGAYPAAATHAGGEKNRNVGKSRHEIRENRTDAGSGARSGGTFSKTFTFNVSDYNVTQQDSFDLLDIPGAETNFTELAPILPYFVTTLRLPKDSSVVSLRLVGGDTISLGQLNIPSIYFIPGTGLYELSDIIDVEAGMYPETNYDHRVRHGRDDTEVIIFFDPVQHNADTKETTLWTEATVEVQYQVEECIFISALRTDKEDYITTEPVIVTATLHNVGDTDVTGLTATLTVTDIIEQEYGAVREPVESVPAGGSREVTVIFDNGLDTDTYDLLLEIRDAGGSVVASLSDWVKVASGRTGVKISGESVIPGDPLDLTVTYENYHAHQVTASVLFEIYDERGDTVMSVPASPMEIPASSSADITWHLFTGNLPPGRYEAVGGAGVDGDMRTSPSYYFTVRDPDDLDCDSGVTLADAVIALRLAASGDTPPEFCFGDIDGDRKTGLAEAVHILQKVAMPE